MYFLEYQTFMDSNGFVDLGRESLKIFHLHKKFGLKINKNLGYILF